MTKRKDPALHKKDGRPKIYTEVEKLQAAADKYFEDCKSMKLPPTITGLTMALDFNSRQTLHEYEKDPKFSDAIKRARLKVENSYEMQVRSKNPTGAIFVLKTMGWDERQTQQTTGELKITVEEKVMS